MDAQKYLGSFVVLNYLKNMDGSNIKYVPTS